MVNIRSFDMGVMGEVGDINSLALGNAISVHDFVSFYISDEDEAEKVIATLKAKGIDDSASQIDIEKSLHEFEEIQQKLAQGEKLPKGKTLEENTFYIIFTTVHEAMKAQGGNDFSDFLENSALTDGEKRKIEELNLQISQLDKKVLDGYEKDLAKYVKGERNMKRNLLIDLYVLLEKTLQEGVGNRDLDRGFRMIFKDPKKRAEVKKNVAGILGDEDVEALKETQDYKDFVEFLTTYKTGQVRTSDEKELLFRQNKFYIAFQYMVSEFVKETLKNLEKSTYLGLPPQLGARITGENLELTKLFLLKYPTDAILMLFAFNGLFFGGQLVFSSIGLTPEMWASIIPSEVIALIGSIYSVKLRTNAKNHMMAGNGVFRSIGKAGVIPLFALSLVIGSHYFGATSVGSRTGVVAGTFDNIGTNFKSFSGSLTKVIGEPGKEADSELGLLPQKFYDKCLDVVKVESQQGSQGREAGFGVNSYAKYYLCFGLNASPLDTLGGKVTKKSKKGSTAAYDNAVSFRKKIRAGVSATGFMGKDLNPSNLRQLPDFEDKYSVSEYVKLRIAFFRQDNEALLKKIYGNKQLIDQYKKAISQGFVGNFIDYYVWQTSYKIEGVKGNLTQLSTDVEKLKVSYAALQKDLLFIKKTVEEGLDAIDRTGKKDAQPNDMAITVPTLEIDTKVVEQIGPELSKALESSRDISTKPFELHNILTQYYGLPIALTIIIGSILIALLAETGPLFLSRGMMRRRGAVESRELETLLPNLIKDMRTVVKRVSKELEDSQIMTFLGIGEITEDQIFEGLIEFINKKAPFAMGVEKRGRSFRRQTLELLDPYDHSENGEKYDELVGALMKLQTPKGILEFLTEVLPGLGRTLRIYKNDIKAADLVKDKPNLVHVQKLPDSRSIAIRNNSKQKILSYRRRKVGVTYLMNQISTGQMTLDSLGNFISENEFNVLRKALGEGGGSRQQKMSQILALMRDNYAALEGKAIQDFKDVAKISHLDIPNVQREIDQMTRDDEILSSLSTQVGSLLGVIADKQRSNETRVHQFEITSNVNLEINVMRGIIGDFVEEASRVRDKTDVSQSVDTVLNAFTPEVSDLDEKSVDGNMRKTISEFVDRELGISKSHYKVKAGYVGSGTTRNFVFTIQNNGHGDILDLPPITDATSLTPESLLNWLQERSGYMKIQIQKHNYIGKAETRQKTGIDERTIIPLAGTEDREAIFRRLEYEALMGEVQQLDSKLLSVQPEEIQFDPQADKDKNISDMSVPGTGKTVLQLSEGWRPRKRSNNRRGMAFSFETYEMVDAQDNELTE